MRSRFATILTIGFLIMFMRNGEIKVGEVIDKQGFQYTVLLCSNNRDPLHRVKVQRNEVINFIRGRCEDFKEF